MASAKNREKKTNENIVGNRNTEQFYYARVFPFYLLLFLFVCVMCFFLFARACASRPKRSKFDAFVLNSS